MICIPEFEDAGWVLVAEKMNRFARDSIPVKKSLPKSYKEAAEIPPWPDLVECSGLAGESSEVDFQVDENSCHGALSFLERHLVGRVGELDCPIPSRLEMQNWVDLRWKTTGGVKVVDMNGKFFLFEFPSKPEASRFLQKMNWVFDQKTIILGLVEPGGLLSSRRS